MLRPLKTQPYQSLPNTITQSYKKRELWTEHYHPIDTINNNSPLAATAAVIAVTAEAAEAVAVAVDIIIVAAVEEGGDIIHIDVMITAVDDTLDGDMIIMIVMVVVVVVVVVGEEDIIGVVDMDVVAVVDDVSFLSP